MNEELYNQYLAGRKLLRADIGAAASAGGITALNYHAKREHKINNTLSKHPEGQAHLKYLADLDHKFNKALKGKSAHLTKLISKHPGISDYAKKSMANGAWRLCYG